MSRLIRGVVWALALPSLYIGIATLLPPSRPSAALLAIDPGPIDRPLHMIAADFDRDGYEDLAIANFRAGTVTILINQKNGRFAPQKDSPFSVGPATISTVSAGPLFMVTGDFDREDVDGDAVANNVDNCPNVYNPINTAAIQPDTGSLGVGDACRTTTVVDSDGDGVPDYDPNTHVLDNCPLTFNPGQELEVAAGLDNICYTADDNDFLYGTDGQCNTTDDLISKVGAACSRSPDLAIVETTSGGGSILGIMRVRVNDGRGGLRSRTSLQLSIGPVQAVVFDFNRDLKPDMVVSDSATNALLAFTGSNDGEFGPICAAGTKKGQICGSNVDCPASVCQRTLVIATGNQPAGLAAGDFNGDGNLDLAVANRADRSVGLYTNTGTALPAAATATLSTERGPSFLLAGPARNGDTCAMLVVLDQDLQVCGGGVNDGKFCVTDADCPGGTGIPAGTCQSAGADHGHIETFEPSVCAVGSTMNLVQTIDLGSGHRPIKGALVDFDGDGNADLAVADFIGGQVLVYQGNGDGSFVVPPLTLPGGPFASPSAISVLNYDPNNGPRPDIAVLGFASNRIDLIHNDSVPGALSFSVAPTTPVSPWSDVTAMSLFAADGSVGQDLVLLVGSPPRLDVLSGTGDTFRVLPPEPLSSPSRATGMSVADLRQDGVLDMLVLDGPGGKVTPLISEFTGAQTERPAVTVGANPVQAAVGPLNLHGDDYDRDGVSDLMDNCPTVYNPPGCPVNDPIGHPECYVNVLCADTAPGGLVPNDCGQTNAAGQCDSDNNGVGDQCQVLNALACSGGTNSGFPCTLATAGTDCPLGTCTCPNLDTDQDLIPDYDQFSTTNPKKIDNCPWTSNNAQTDADGNGIGDLCDDTTCVVQFFSGQCNAGPRAQAPCVTDVDCEVSVNDIVAVNKGSGSLSLLIGDTSGTFRPAPGSWSTLGGFSNPTAAPIGHFSFSCFTDVFGNTSCSPKPQTDIVVAEQANPGSSDDTLKLFVGDGSGVFTAPGAPVAPVTALQGDPTDLLLAENQKVCANPWILNNDPRFRFEKDRDTSVVAAIEPASSSIGVLLPSSQGMVPPPGNPNPLLLSSPPAGALFIDLNQDGILDLVALSSGDGNPATPNLVVFIGMGNGLFFTDPTLDPVGVPDGMTFLAAGNINLATDETYPDIALFSSVDQAPIILTNILKERADIDGSGRVDGYDLAVMAHSFGAQRGENFTLQSDGTFVQTGTGATRVLVPSGCVQVAGHDMPDSVVPCDRTLELMSSQNAHCSPSDPLYPDPGVSLYGLPVDVDLDGIVDGKDLALLASEFGRTL